MTVKLKLRPEIEASLTAQADAKGMPLDAYLQEAIEELAGVNFAPAPGIQELRTTLDKLAEMGQNLPRVSSSSFSRESIYRDHN